MPPVRDLYILFGLVGISYACHGPAPSIQPRPIPEFTAELGPGDVTGFVLDSATGLPIANAHVFLGQDSAAHLTTVRPPVGTITDSLGRFRFSALSPGAYLFVAGFIGYRTRQVRVRLTEGTSAVVTLGLGRIPTSCDYMPKGTLCY